MSNSDVLAKFADASGNADTLVNLARVSEQAERYDDMCSFMKALCEQKTDLSVEERNLLSVAYKNVVGSRRASWRTLNVDDSNDSKLIETYKAIVEGELDKICGEVLALLTDRLIPAVKGKGDESEVFYEKMAADYYRYLSEFKDGSDDKPSSEGVKATEHYENAYNIAKASLAETHPTRLGLALNFSVCYYEILKQPEKACSLAKEAFDAAIQKLDSLTDESYKDSTLIMQLLRDNLTLWTSETEQDGGAVEEVED